MASLVLAGGAGTRFGGAVKALVPVSGDRTFLDYKLADARQAGAAGGRPVPVAIMTSPLTHAGIAAHVQGLPDVHLFEQRMLPRLTPELEIFRGADGQPSLAPSGHGDVLRALRASGVGEALRRRGVRLLYFTNVDNLAASLDPLVIGAHLALGKAMMVEVTARRRADGGLDTGAAPVRVKGHVQLVEHVEKERHPLISTNDITFELARLLDQEIRAALARGAQGGGGPPGAPARAGHRRGDGRAGRGREAGPPQRLPRGAARGPGHHAVRAGQGARGPAAHAGAAAGAPGAVSGATTTMIYDADTAPDAQAWAAAGDTERLAAVEAHHRTLTSPHPKQPRPRLHAAIHMVVETQAATGEPPQVARALERLVAGGLSRHEAVHAVGMLVANVMSASMEGRAYEPAVYARELDELTAERWRSLAQEQGG
ncbi:MAG: UTP--glucose-1-phosphate uridylyltransferase [Anaeromyxobacter sp.]